MIPPMFERLVPIESDKARTGRIAVVQSMCYSCTVLTIISGGPQLSVTPALWDPVTSSDLHRHLPHVYTHALAHPHTSEKYIFFIDDDDECGGRTLILASGGA